MLNSCGGELTSVLSLTPLKRLTSTGNRPNIPANGFTLSTQPKIWEKGDLSPAVSQTSGILGKGKSIEAPLQSQSQHRPV